MTNHTRKIICPRHNKPNKGGSFQNGEVASALRR